MSARIVMSDHADRRCSEHGVTAAEVGACVAEPWISYPGDARQGVGRIVRVRDRLTAVISVGGTVITVMPSGHATGYNQWSHLPEPSTGRVG